MDSKTLLALQPDYYKNSDVMFNLNNTNAIELALANETLIDKYNQLFVDTASNSLSRWEDEYGLEIANNYDSAYRKSKIISKIKGQETITIAQLKNVVESFENGTVEVVEDNANYCFTIRFVDTIGVPPNIQDVYDAIEDIKPAHLGVTYEFKYTTWGEIAQYRYDELLACTWGEILNGGLTHQDTPKLVTKLSDDTVRVIKFVEE